MDTLSAASVVGVAHQVVGTAALVAARQVCTRSSMRARATAMQTLVDIFAFRVHTHVSSSTVMVFGAFRKGNQAAAFLGVSSITWQAFARCLMVKSSALGVDATNASKAARVLAMSVDTHLVERAVVVIAATLNAFVGYTDLSESTIFISSARVIRNFFTSHDGVACVAMFTGAKFSVVDRRAASVSAAHATALARVLALSINAGEVRRAVGVSSAAHSAMGKLTNAARIAVVVSCALWRR